MKQLDIKSQITWIYTENLEQTCHFYARSIGLELELDEGLAQIFTVTSTAKIGVCTAMDNFRVTEPKGSMITFVCDDVDGWYERLLERGVTILESPHILKKFNIYTLFVEDPNGYVIEFQKFLD